MKRRKFLQWLGIGTTVAAAPVIAKTDVPHQYGKSVPMMMKEAQAALDGFYLTETEEYRWISEHFLPVDGWERVGWDEFKVNMLEGRIEIPETSSVTANFDTITVDTGDLILCRRVVPSRFTVS